MSLQLYHALGQINKIKRKELVLPIAKKEVVVSPLSVGDDLILKTALISPVKLDKELMKLLWAHTEFWVPNVQTEQQSAIQDKPEIVDGVEIPRKRKKKVQQNDLSGGSYKKISERDFYNQISYFDKLVLLWGIYNVTYVTLGNQEIECPKCGEKFTKEVYLDDTMHEDSITLFDPEVPFNKYTETISIPINDDYILEFIVCIPSMSDFNRILGLIPISELQSNLENIRSQFNTEQLMTLYTKKLAVYKKDKPSERAESTISSEILSSLRDYVNIEISSEFFRQYSEKFSKYNINFYQKCECPNCKETTNLGVDIEYHFFLKQLPR